MANCKGCGAEVVWALSANGKKMPFDAKPIKAWTVTESVNRGMVANPVDTFVSHFSTCPRASEFRNVSPTLSLGEK